MYKFFSIICFLNLIVLTLFTPIIWFAETTGETAFKQIIQKFWLTGVSFGVGIILFALGFKCWNK